MKTGHKNRLILATVAIVLGIDSRAIREADGEIRFAQNNPKSLLHLMAWAARTGHIYGQFWHVLLYTTYKIGLPSPPIRTDYIDALKPRVEAVREAMETGTPIPHVRHYQEIQEVIHQLQIL